MRTRLLKSLILLAFAGACGSALADDIPALAGRVALAQGPVSIGMDGNEPMAAQVNWPVTAGESVTTARGARTELQVGGAFIRLDGDSSLQVLQLDDGNLRLRLHYGSASIRILDPGMLAGFALETPEGRVTLQEPGRIRVDAERVADTSSVTVIDGAARVEGSGANLLLRAGKRADLRDDDVRTFAAASRDEFDDWSLERDRAADTAVATRYVSPDMTGYTDLDRYGNWQTDPEYGALWFPTTVSAGWVPYSDGSWVWIDPWGWTWVDNAPWGYAPFHYGRWVFTHNRWGWVPGHRERHPVWSPALVGWVGGGDWRFNHEHRPTPARGWYPLSPHDRYVPSYRMADEHLRRVNEGVRPDPRRHNEEHRGLTMVPQEQFGQRGRVPVASVPHSSLPPGLARQLQNVAPPAAPAVARERGGFEHRNWPNGQQPAQVLTAPSVPPAARGPEQRPAPQQWHDRRGNEEQRAATVLTAPSVAPAQPAQQQWRDRRGNEDQRAATVLTAPSVAPAQPAQQQWRDRRGNEEQRPATVLTAPPAAQPAQQQWRDRRGNEEQRPATVLTAPPAAQPAPPQWHDRRGNEEPRPTVLSTAPAPVQPPAQPAPDRRQFDQGGAPPDRFERRRSDIEFERRREQAVAAAQFQAAAPQPVQPMPAPAPVVPHYQPMPAPPPVVPHIAPMQAPPPVTPQVQQMPQQPAFQPAARPAPAAAPAAGQGPRHEGEHRGGRREDRREQDK